MSLEVKELAGKDMSQLCDVLQECEAEQEKIYAVYRRAAEMDEKMRELKKNERMIRIYMNSKIGI